jgi:hypothetical protein
MGADPANTFARAKIDEMRSAAKRLQPGPGTGVGILCRDPDYAAWPASSRQTSTCHLILPAKVNSCLVDQLRDPEPSVSP